MNSYNKDYEEQLISLLICIHEKPGAYLGTPSLAKLLDFMAGYIVAVYNLTGYHIIFERRFLQFLCQKYHIKENECSLSQFFQNGKDDAEGFEAFFRELNLFCKSNEVRCNAGDRSLQ